MVADIPKRCQPAQWDPEDSTRRPDPVAFRAAVSVAGLVDEEVVGSEADSEVIAVVVIVDLVDVVASDIKVGAVGLAVHPTASVVASLPSMPPLVQEEDAVGLVGMVVLQTALPHLIAWVSTVIQDVVGVAMMTVLGIVEVEVAGMNVNPGE